MLASALIAIFDFQKIVDKIESSIALAAFVGILLLVPLFLSQRRDIQRLTEFRERHPKYPGSDLATSEALLDRAEAELEEIYADRGEPMTAEEGPVAATVVHPDGLAGETSERPALDRRTSELAALEPHPRWKQWRDRLTRPRWLAAIAVGAAVIAGAVVIGSESLSSNGGDTPPPPPAANAVDPTTIKVAVLNGTSKTGLAAKVSADITPEGYQLGEVTNLSGAGDFPQTVVYFQPKDKVSKEAARKVAKLLGKARVQEITPQAQKLAGDADVVVVAGDDRAI